MDAAFGQWLSPADIATFGIDTITGDPNSYMLIARATHTTHGAAAAWHRRAGAGLAAPVLT
jgi:hypothetical protein